MLDSDAEPEQDRVEAENRAARLDPARALDEAEERVFGAPTDRAGGDEDRDDDHDNDDDGPAPADPVDDESGTGVDEESPG